MSNKLIVIMLYYDFLPFTMRDFGILIPPNDSLDRVQYDECLIKTHFEIASLFAVVVLGTSFGY